ncbi:MAG: aspartate aminotransferase family protein [Actinobacteria bacterium]|nr:aspartate aminotransferase family protein [Actinomycetota bacterium]
MDSHCTLYKVPYPDLSSLSAKLFERGQEVMPGGNSRVGVMFQPYPLYAAFGKGCRVTDVEGVERIDFINNWSSLIHGHGNPQVLAAIAEQSQRLLAVGMPTEVEIELAELLTSRVPGVEQIRFSNSGSEGVLMALRAAKAFTGRPKIAKVEGAYHGNADAIEVSVAPSPKQWGAPEAPATVASTEGLTAGVLQDSIVLPFNDVEDTRRIIEAHAHELAAVVIDPVVSRMGFVQATPEYLRMVRDVTEQHGVLLVFDEVFSFRMGYRGAQGEVGITPDLTALGKIIGGGLPVGATGGRRDVMAVFDQTKLPLRVEHGGTYNANPMTMAAGLAAMQQMTPAAYDRLNALGDRARDGLRAALHDSGLVGAVHGCASMVALIFNDAPFSNYRELPLRRREAEMISTLHRYLLNHGVTIIPHGMMLLSTAMTEDDIDEMLTAMRGGMKVLAGAASE